MQIQRLPNFKIPGFETGATEKHLNMTNMVKALSRKYKNVANYYNLIMNQMWNLGDDLFGISDDESSSVSDMDEFYFGSDSDDYGRGYYYGSSPYDNDYYHFKDYYDSDD